MDTIWEWSGAPKTSKFNKNLTPEVPSDILKKLLKYWKGLIKFIPGPEVTSLIV